MRMNSLRTKVFISFVSLLLLVQAVSLGIFYQTNGSQENTQIQNRLNNAISTFHTQFDSRSYYLTAFAETAAKDFGLKQVFGSDNRSFLIALNNHRKRIEADMAIAVDNKGFVVGQLMRTEQSSKVKIGYRAGETFPDNNWFRGNNTTVSGLYRQNNHVYQLSFAPLRSGQRTVGWVGYGYLIDSRLAQQFAGITGMKVEFLLNSSEHDWELLAAAAPDTMQGVTDYGKQILSEHTLPASVGRHNAIDGIISTSTHIGFVDGMDLYAAIYGSRANLLETLRKNWWRLIVLEAATILIALLAAYMLAGGISRPVKRLVQQAKYIARGNYDTSVEIAESNELGQLAREFNTMQRAVLVREQTITHQLYFDGLSNLPNRNSLLQHLEQLFEESDTEFALVHLDIRRTKTVNDTLGYETGNQLITECGNRLNRLANGSGLYHLGADEFALIIPQADIDTLGRWQQDIEQALDEPLCGDGTLLHLQIHAGIASAPAHAENPDKLMQKADTALSHSKRDHKTFLHYEPQMDADAGRRLSLVNDLKVAIEQNQLCLFYQPKLNLVSGRIHHLEALVRWIHPEQGMIPPDAFISIAEQTGQIDALTDWVIREAARQFTEWKKQGLRLCIAVNISAENLKNHTFTHELKQIWEDYNLPQEALSLEITESAVVHDPDSAISMLCDIRDQGIKLSIDDYGTGYSSLAQLKKLPVQELKIDRSFVDKIHKDNDNQIIVRSTIRMAHDMGLTVVAEGIEDTETLDWLRQHQCELAQGYFISRPQPAKELIDWLATSEYSGVEDTVSNA